MSEIVTKDHFSDLRERIATIKEENKNMVFDYELDEKEARSHVATMRKSKTAITKLHKEKKAFFLESGRKLDTAKNELIKDVDEMIEVHAKPLQDLKDKQDREAAEKLALEQFNADYDEALSIDDLVNREKAMAKKEAEQLRLEDERIAKAKAEQDEKDRIENEARIKKEAEEKATADAELKIQKEREESQRLIEEAKQREEQAKIDAENAETKRLADIQAVKDKAEADQNKALEDQKKKQAEKEEAERKRIAEEKRISDKKAANRNHQAAVNNKVVAKLMSIEMETLPTITNAMAIEIVKALIKNPIKEISINY